ncbi:MAG TPA: N-glycosylase/DNA lyase [Bacteroidota bacterium]|jgi:N-glycosylase/DNA lyase|nr:N-glycosylase/DNA lyase [Bacteroidota bacterium]
MTKKRPGLSIDALQELFDLKRSAIRLRLAEFKQVHPSEYFYELVYCLLTPQSSAVNAEKAVRLLRQHDFLNADVDPEPLLHQKEFYIRFHRTKTKNLLELKPHYPEIEMHVLNGTPAKDLREWLVRNVRGLGWKEASHFLRNVGHENLAILDRHILRNLLRTGVLRTLPKTLTPKRYLAIEEKFLTFARRTGISMDELDLLFWSMETGEIRK